jgi:hypothetical protein
MAVPEQTPYKEYIGNGVTTNFALGFTCDLKQELKVFINDIEPELSTWSLTGGSVSFTTAPSSGSKIVLKRATKLERTTNYLSSNNSFRPEAINKDFDRVWYAIQEQNYKAGQYDYDYNFVLTQVRPINTGGTGANNVFNARSNLDVYSKSEVDSLVSTGGEGNVIGVAGGGTGGTTAEQARINLSIYSKTETDTAIANATPDASEIALGVAKIATTEIAQAGTNDTDIITTKKLRNALNAEGGAPIFACRAWVNFNGAPLSGTYAQSGTTVTVTMTAHGMSVGQNVNLTFTSGTAVSGSFTVTSIASANTFTITASTSLTTSGNVTRNLYIRASGNVSSITDNAVGDYTINFTTAMPDANYAASLAFASGADSFASLMIRSESSNGLATLKTANALRVIYKGLSISTLYDVADASVVILR